MSGFSSFALFGVGQLGVHVLAAMLSHPAAHQLSIRILSRPGSPRLPGLPPNIVSYWPIDYSKPDLAEAQLVKALSGVEVVISTVGSGLQKGEDVKTWADAGKHIGHLPGFISQAIVARAAKRAACQLFVPAEYGSPSHCLDPNNGSFVRGKKILQDELRRMNLPWMLVYAGVFPQKEPPQTMLPPNTAVLPPAPFETTRWHLGQFLTHLVLDLPQEDLEWGIFMIRGYRREYMSNGQWMTSKSL